MLDSPTSGVFGAEISRAWLSSSAFASCRRWKNRSQKSAQKLECSLCFSAAHGQLAPSAYQLNSTLRLSYLALQQVHLACMLRGVGEREFRKGACKRPYEPFRTLTGARQVMNTHNHKVSAKLHRLSPIRQYAWCCFSLHTRGEPALRSLAFAKRGVKMCTRKNGTFCANYSHARINNAIRLKLVCMLPDYSLYSIHCSARL